MSEAEVTTAEIWRPIPLTNGLYEASSLGRIKCLRRVVAAGPGSKGSRVVRERILRTALHHSGYVIASVRPRAGVVLQRMVHRFVADAFLGPCPDGLQVNHKNGKRDDNRVENLEYVTISENHVHSFRVLGRISGRQILSDQQVVDLRSRYDAGGISFAQLAAEFGISKAQARRLGRRIQR